MGGLCVSVSPVYKLGSGGFGKSSSVMGRVPTVWEGTVPNEVVTRASTTHHGEQESRGGSPSSSTFFSHEDPGTCPLH